MNGENPEKLIPSPDWPRVIGSCVWLTLALLLVFPAFAWFGYSQHGLTGLAAAAIAGGICWLGALLALVCSAMFQGPQQAANSMMLGMMFRMGLPLGTGLLLTMQKGALAEAGVLMMILVYYLLAMAVETLLSLRFVNSAKQASKVS